MRGFELAAVTAAVGLGLGCATAPPVSDCVPEGRARPICIFQSPEDLVALPGDAAILVSEFGGMEGEHGGALSLFVLESEERRVLFRGGDADGQTARWGDPACPGPPPVGFSPHGIQLSHRRDGALQLLVVQHGGRESVEFFEVVGIGTDWALAWRGCVVGPEDASFNSVAALPEGGFLVTKMASRGSIAWQMFKGSVFGASTGLVYEWQPASGLQPVPDTEDVMPNGIEVSADGRRFHLNTSGGKHCRIERDGSGRECIETPPLDNARWAPDGRLLVAQLLGLSFRDFRACQNLESGACPLEFQIVAIDPETLATEVLYHNEGPPMGAGTVGLQVGRELFIGSFVGDRILRVSLD